MTTLLHDFWPVFVAGLVIGGLAGTIGLYRHKLKLAVAVGIALSLVATWIWHGPAGAADRFAATAERQARESLVYYEMTKVTAHLHRGPLTRRLVLAGPADAWQRGELVRLFGQVPGVSGATWSERDAGLPLLVEEMLGALAGFLLGLLVAWLVQLRRRYNAQWTW